MHAHTPWHTYTHHAHPHLHDDRVYKCTHCGRKGHLVRFYFDGLNSLNFANKNVWFSIATNLHGPKKKWVQKFSSLVFDIGVGSHMTWEVWCLDDGCVWARWTYQIDASLWRMFGGRTTIVWRPRDWFIGFDNYL